MAWRTLSASGVARMLVVVCRSHCAWRQTSSRVAGEGHVALEDAGTHASGRLVGLLRVLGELQGSAAVTDREIARSVRLDLGGAFR